MIDNDCDGLIDCLDPDCPPCPLIRSDPTQIRFGPSGVGLDVLRSRGYVKLPAAVDLSRTRIGWLISTPGRIVYEGVLEPGDLTAAPSSRNRFFFLDPGAPTGQGTHDGIYKATLIVGSSVLRYKLQAYGDMAPAATANMAVQFYVGGDQPFIVSATWQSTTVGWSLKGHHGAGLAP
jgi:hypothetical protein